MTFEEELRRVVDALAEHLRHEAAGRLQAAMPALYDASKSEQDAAVAQAVEHARAEAERTLAERLDAAKHEAEEQLERAQREAADRLAASEQLATEQLASARRDHEEQISSMLREVADQLAAKERDAAEQLAAKEREAGDQLIAKDREAAERLHAHERAAAERLELVESAAAQRVLAETADARSQAHDAGRAEGRKEGRETLAEALLALGRARSLSEVLDTLGSAAERHTAGVAVLLVRGNQLRTWKLTGFGETADHAAPFDLALPHAGIIRDAVQTGALVRSDSSKEAAIPAFADPATVSRTLAAVPLVVGGQVVAVLYGDGPAEEDGGWQLAFDALAAFASRLLEAMTAFRTATLLTTETRQAKRES